MSSPITSTLLKYPTRIRLEYEKVKGMVAMDQIWTIDKQRIIRIIGNFEITEIEQIKQTIEESYVK